MKPSTFQQIALVLVICFATLIGCKKDVVLDPLKPDSYIQYTINGKNSVLTAEAGFSSAVDNGKYVAVLGAGQMAGVNKNVIVIIWGDDEAFNTKTYTDFTSALPNAKKCSVVQLAYTDEAGKTWASWPEDMSSLLNTQATSRLTISSLTEQVVTGSFSGLLYNEDFTKSIAISNGVFRLKKWQ